MGSEKYNEPVTIERLERGLLILAHLMENDGAAYVPLYEKLEREIETLQRTKATMERARQRLEANRHWLVELGLTVRAKSK